MTTSLFPAILGPETTAASKDLPMFREIKWDFDQKRPIFAHGEPVIVEGGEAVRVWAWHALQAERYRYEHESWRYGCELTRLRGKSYQKGTVEAEARRYITEALTASPYITSVEVPKLELVGDTLEFTVKYKDVYGGGDTLHV